MNLISEEVIIERLARVFLVMMMTAVLIIILATQGEKPAINAPKTREIAARYEEKTEIPEEEMFSEETAMLSGKSEILHTESLDFPRELAVQTIAQDYVGHFTYEFGHKANTIRYEPDAMDCSGFVQYVYWLAEHSKNEYLESTLAITHNMILLNTKKGEEPQIGDIGVMFPDGSYYFDMKGNKFYIEYEAKESNRRIKEQAEKELEELEPTYDASGCDISDEELEERYAGAAVEYLEQYKQNFNNQSEYADYDAYMNAFQLLDFEVFRSSCGGGVTYTESEEYKQKKKELEDKIEKASKDPEAHINHCGIIVGKNEENGNYIFCHLNSTDNTVSMEEYPAFKYFYHVPK